MVSQHGAGTITPDSLSPETRQLLDEIVRALNLDQAAALLQVCGDAGLPPGAEETAAVWPPGEPPAAVQGVRRVWTVYR